MPFIVEHQITKRLIEPALSHRHFFRIVDRPSDPLIAYVELLDKKNQEYMKYRIEIRGLMKKSEYKQFKQDKFFGNFWIDTPPRVALPSAFRFEVKYGLITRRKETFLLFRSEKYEDLMSVSTIESFMKKREQE